MGTPPVMPPVMSDAPVMPPVMSDAPHHDGVSLLNTSKQ